jgi:hypothetical protein
MNDRYRIRFHEYDDTSGLDAGAAIAQARGRQTGSGTVMDALDHRTRRTPRADTAGPRGRP